MCRQAHRARCQRISSPQEIEVTLDRFIGGEIMAI
jgi:hypothetical protein